MNKIKNKIIKKLLSFAVMDCEDCHFIGVLYCGPCGGSRCEVCYMVHISDCSDCLKWKI